MNHLCGKGKPSPGLEVDEDGVYADGLSNTVLFREELKRSNPLGLLDDELELDV